MAFLIVTTVLALGLGIWVGLGMPGWNGGRKDRLVPPGRAKRLPHNHIHWIKPKRR